MTIGEKIIQMAPSLFEICGEQGMLKEIHSVVWSSTAADQFDALVEAEIRLRLEANEVVRRAIDGGEK